MDWLKLEKSKKFDMKIWYLEKKFFDIIVCIEAFR